MKKSNSPYVAATKSVNRSAGVKPAVTSPVSQKFYRYMEERIAGACLLLGGKIRHEDVMAVINRYLYAAELPGTGIPTEILLIFTLLRPEIDKAMARTAAARARAAARGRKSGSKTSEPSRDDAQAIGETGAAPTAPEADSEPAQPRLSRSERRRAQQKVRRASRRRVKPLAGKRL